MKIRLIFPNLNVIIYQVQTLVQIIIPYSDLHVYIYIDLLLNAKICF